MLALPSAFGCNSFFMSGQDLQLTGNLSCNDATIRGGLETAGAIAGSSLTVTTLNATTANIGTANANDANVGTLLVRVVQLTVANPLDITTTPQNNLALGGLDGAVIMRLLSSVAGPISITGIQPPAGIVFSDKLVTFLNRPDSVATIVLEHENAASQPPNRFLNHGAANVALAPGEARIYLYDLNAQRWIQAS